MTGTGVRCRRRRRAGWCGSMVPPPVWRAAQGMGSARGGLVACPCSLCGEGLRRCGAFRDVAVVRVARSEEGAEVNARRGSFQRYHSRKFCPLYRYPLDGN